MSSSAMKMSGFAEGRKLAFRVAVGGANKRQFNFSSFFSGLKGSLLDEKKIYSREGTSAFQIAKERRRVKDIKKSNECQLSRV